MVGWLRVCGRLDGSKDSWDTRRVGDEEDGMKSDRDLDWYRVL